MTRTARLRERGAGGPMSAGEAAPAPHEIDAGGCATGTGEGAPAGTSEIVFDKSVGAPLSVPVDGIPLVTFAVWSRRGARKVFGSIHVDQPGGAAVVPFGLSPTHALELARELELCVDELQGGGGHE